MGAVRLGLRNILFLVFSELCCMARRREIYRETKRDRDKERERNPGEHLHGFHGATLTPVLATSARQLPSEICPASAFLTWGRSDEADFP